jgi:hypothetical protein
MYTNLLVNRDSHDILFFELGDLEGLREIGMELAFCSALLASVQSIVEIFGNYKP